MTEYKIINRKTFSKESTFQDTLNAEARNRWKVISVGYSMDGAIVKAILERTDSNNY